MLLQNAVQKLICPGVGQVASGGFLPDGGAAHEEHQVIAELRLHDAVVAGLAHIVKAPVVECLHHLTLGNPGVQAAVGGGAVLGIGLGQLGKAVLALIPLLPLGKQFLGLLAAGFPGGIVKGIGADIVGGRALGHHQNVAHVHGLIVLGQAVLLIGLGIVVKVLLHFLVRRLLGLAQVGEVNAAGVVELQEMAVVVQGSAHAHIVLQQFLGVFKAVQGSALLQILNGGVQLGLGFLVQLEAGGFRLGSGGLVVAPAVQGACQEELLPGALGIGNGAGLHIQRLGRIQADIGGIGAVAAQEIPNLRPVEHLQLTVGQGVIAHPGNHRVVGGNHILVRGGVGALGGFVIRVAVGGNGGRSLGFAYLGGLHCRGGTAIHAQENHRCQHPQ